MERLTIRINENVYFTKGKYEQTIPAECESWDVREILKKLADYEDTGLTPEEIETMKFPCDIGDTVYVLAECAYIEKRLDGTLYEADGSFGTATGYYCPYEDCCPFCSDDFNGCESYKNNTAVFEDTVNQITVDECGLYIYTTNCNVCGNIGVDVFLTKEEADRALYNLIIKKEKK